MRFDPPSPEQQRRFLASFVFGSNPEPGIPEVVRRAYLDLSRTVHGIDRADPDGTLRAGAHRVVARRVQRLLSDGPRAQEAFDLWHRRVCTEIAAYFARGGYRRFYIGQAQKWVNMSIKYALTLSEIGWLDAVQARRLRDVAHAPLDQYFLDELLLAQPASAPRLSAPWSRIAAYDEYLEIQSWMRRTFPASALDVEFHLWQQAALRRREGPP